MNVVEQVLVDITKFYNAHTYINQCNFYCASKKKTEDEGHMQKAIKDLSFFLNKQTNNVDQPNNILQSCT